MCHNNSPQHATFYKHGFHHYHRNHLQLQLTGAATHNSSSPAILSPIQPLHNRSPLSLMIVPFIIDDGSLITFMWWCFGLVWCIVAEVLNKHPHPPCVLNGSHLNGWRSQSRVDYCKNNVTTLGHQWCCTQRRWGGSWRALSDEHTALLSSQE